MNEYKITDKMHSWQKTYPVWVSALSVIVLLIIWELICRAGIVSPLFLPSPTGILIALAAMVAGGLCARQCYRPCRRAFYRHFRTD